MKIQKKHPGEIIIDLTLCILGILSVVYIILDNIKEITL